MLSSECNLDDSINGKWATRENNVVLHWKWWVSGLIWKSQKMSYAEIQREEESTTWVFVSYIVFQVFMIECQIRYNLMFIWIRFALSPHKRYGNLEQIHHNWCLSYYSLLFSYKRQIHYKAGKKRADVRKGKRRIGKAKWCESDTTSIVQSRILHVKWKLLGMTLSCDVSRQWASFFFDWIKQ